jgi:hypothetical protein
MPWIRERAARVRAARYLAIRVVCVLDEFIDNCASVAVDSGSEGKDGVLEPQVSAPAKPSYPDDLDWQSIAHDLTYDLLSLPNAVTKAEGVVDWANENDGPPDFSEFFETRSIQYATIGLRANTLATKLRVRYRIPARPPVADDNAWDPVCMLGRVVRETQQRALARMNSLSL